MWRSFCRHVVDVENEYWEKDGLMEDMVKELTIDATEDSNDSDNEEELLDSDDRRWIEGTIRQAQSTNTEQSTSRSRDDIMTNQGES